MLYRRMWPLALILAAAMISLPGCGTEGVNQNEKGGQKQAKIKPKDGGKIPPLTKEKEKEPVKPKKVVVGKGFETPQAVFDAAKNALKEGEFEEFASLLDEERKNVTSGSLVLAVALFKSQLKDAQANPDVKVRKAIEGKLNTLIMPFQKVFAKHELNTDVLKMGMANIKAIQTKSPGVASFKTMLTKLAEPIKNRRAFIGQALMVVKSTGMELPIDPEGKLKDVEVTGVKATATLVDSKGKEQPIAFVKLKDSWLIAMPAEQYTQMLNELTATAPESKKKPKE